MSVSQSNIHASLSPINNSPSKQMFSFPKADRFSRRKPTYSSHMNHPL